MENIIYTAAVLGSLCSEGADKPGVVASVVKRLHDIDVKLTAYVRDEDKSGIDRTDCIDALMDVAKDLFDLLRLTTPGELVFSGAIAAEKTGCLVIEMPGTSWDTAAPLLLS